MTPPEAVSELFARLPATGKDIVWLADELIGIAQHVGSVSLEVLRDEAGDRTLVCQSSSSVPPLTLTGREPLYLFRPLLARFAVVGAEETGTEISPYGGQCALSRSSRSGPVRLEIEFTNTPATQRLAITRTPVSISRPNGAPVETTSSNPSPQSAS
jgi:hypothetical protein